MPKHTQPTLIPPQRGDLQLDNITLYVYTGSHWQRVCDQYVTDGDAYDYQTRRWHKLADGLQLRAAGMLLTRRGNTWKVTEINNA